MTKREGLSIPVRPFLISLLWTFSLTERREASLQLLLGLLSLSMSFLLDTRVRALTLANPLFVATLDPSLAVCPPAAHDRQYCATE
jgi:hypothetical protein